MNFQNEAFWRKFVEKDSELDVATRATATAHLGECAACQKIETALRARVELVDSVLSDTAGQPQAAWSRFERERLTPTRARPLSINNSLAAVVIGAVVLIGGMATAPGQSLANDMLDLFRAETLAAVRIDPDAIRHFDPSEMGDIEIDEPSGRQVESLAEAAKMTGLDIRLPSEPRSGLKLAGIHASTAGEARLTLDAERLKTFLGEEGAADIALSPLIDGSTITALIPPTVMVEYVDDQSANATPVLLMGQAAAPEISGPVGIDLDSLRDDLLKMPLFSRELSEQLADISDWQRTLPIPYPAEDVAATELTVKPDGDGLYFKADDGSRVLIWTADDQVFGIVAPLDSPLSRAELLDFARDI